MVKYIFFVLPAFLFYYYGHAQKTDHTFTPLLTLQATSTKYQNSDRLYGASATFGAKYKDMIGVGINAQLMKFQGDKNYLNPLSGEIVFSVNSGKLRPFANFQIGKAFYNNHTMAQTGNGYIDTRIKGGLFISPGLGMLLKFKNADGMALTGSYVSTNFTSNSTISLYNFSYKWEGYRIGLGFTL